MNDTENLERVWIFILAAADDVWSLKPSSSSMGDLRESGID